MTRERHARVKEIFLAACEVSVDRRDAFLDQACDGDPSLRREVAELLAHDHAPASIMQSGFNEQRVRDRLESILESSGEGHDHASESGRRPLPLQIGRYRVLGLLGAGGMGVVYLAEQDNPRRQVALKVIAPSQISRQSLRRFEHESQILGRLHHPGIAQVYEAGTHDEGLGAQPYFAMELIKGLPLTQAAEDRNLHQRERLELFMAVCDAVHHAHQHGVVHRDLKPANILVVDSGEDSTGEPRLSVKILDFGVARLSDADRQTTTFHTASQQLLGTISYMSPEQLSGSQNVDTRSDVYALGVILFELLAGRLPHDVTGKSVPESIRILAQDDAMTLSAIDRRLRGDLETVVRKAMERDPSRRYQSAADLAADVRRYLHDVPILARRPSTIYQVRKFARRNKAIVVGVVAVFMVLVGGIVATAWQAREAIAARDVQIELRRRADSSAARARAGNDFLRRMLVSAQPMATQGRDVSVGEVLDAAAAEVEAPDFSMTPDVEALIRMSLGETYLAIGRISSARAHIERAIALSLQAHGEHSPEHAAAMVLLASLVNAEGDAPRANATAVQALAILRSVYAGDHDDIAICMSNIAEYRLAQGDRAGAVAIKTESLEALKRLHGEAGTEIADARWRLALMLHNPAEGEPLLRQAIESYGRTVGERHPKYITAVRDLAGMLLMRRAYDDAIAQNQRAFELGKQVYGEVHPMNLITLSNLAFCYRYAGRREACLAACEQGLQMARQIYGDGFATAQWLMDCADARGSVDDIAGCIADHQKAIGMAEQSGQGASALACASRLTVASLLIRTGGDVGQAQALSEHVIAVADTNPDIQPWMRGQAMSLLGELALRRGDFVEAERMLTAGREQLLGNRLVLQNLRAITERLVRLYEQWEESSPDVNKQVELLKWRAELDELQP